MHRILSVLLLALLGACASVDIDEGKDAPALYLEAKKSLQSENFETALKAYDKLLSRYPYGIYADQAILDSAYAHYKLNQRAQAIADCDRFIQLHPTHPRIDYAYYLKALAYEVKVGGFFDFLGTPDIAERDPQASQDAFDAFKELITRYPDSQYVADSRQRMQHLKRILARSEINNARFYLRRGAPLASIGRAKSVLSDFQDAPEREDALAVLVAAYDRLQETTLRDDALRVLKQNYPDSRWLKDDIATEAHRGQWWQFWR